MMEQPNVEAPVVTRRKRRTARQIRESTPLRDGSVGSQSNSCDDHSGSESRSTGQSTVNSSPATSKRSLIERAMDYGSHRNKILSRKEKKLTIVAPRSRSVPRDEDDEVPSSPEIFSLLRRAKRSLSAMRKPKTDDSSDGGRVSDTEVRKRREKIERFRSERDKDGDGKSSQLQNNLQRFNEERRKFELEKLKFIQEKRELDRMRLRRFDKYREEMLEKQSQKLQTELRSREQQHDRAKSIEATPLPPAPPSRVRSPAALSPAPVKKMLLVVPKTSSASASSSEDEGRLSSDENKKVRRRFSPRKPKRPRSVRVEPITSPESELPSDYQPEVDDSPEKAAVTEQPPVQEPATDEQEAETVLRQRKIPKTDEPDHGTQNGKETVPMIVQNGKEEKSEVRKPDELVRGIKQRRRPLVPYVEKKDDAFTWTEIFMEMRDLWLDAKDDHSQQVKDIRYQASRCILYFVVMVLLCGVGGIVFRLTEGTFESQYKCGVKRVKREFIDQLWISSHNQKEEDWKLTARTRLRKFEEELQIAFEAGMKTYSGNTAWNFINGVIYSLTVVSTIGYGHITPSTTTGRALTIVYAIIGIPIFLIVLADFGKLFTRGIKFLWLYVRRLYYTGSVRKVRKTTQVKEVMRGLNVVYDMVRRPSGEQEIHPTEGQQPQPKQQDADQSQPQPAASSAAIEASVMPVCESPTTPVPETFEIDDEFNLPISVAIFILVAYMLFGATIYFTWENWSFFEAFYFVFISISTIGFGDFVPQHPIYMMCSILYLIFGLALTSMCINVVQLKLSDSFRQASAKIGATIGLQMAEAASLQQSQVQTPVELTGVHTSTPTRGGNPFPSSNGDVPAAPALPTRPSSSVQKPGQKD